MNRRATFGIVGAYGATGRLIASELRNSGEGDLLIGGRDPVKLESLAAQLGGKASTARLDILDARSLDEFCGRCLIVINCGGPVAVLQDRVAQAAFRAGCHYVDPAGMSVVVERMLPHDRDIANRGLSFVVSAGWNPGLTELVPVYAHAQAKNKLDSIESLNMYFSDSGDWSTSALRDGVTYLRELGLPKPGYFEKGTWRGVKASQASSKIDLGDPVGSRRFSLFSTPEQIELGRQLTDCDVRTYSYLAGFRNALAAVAIAIMPLSESTGVGLLRNIFRRNRLPVGGFVEVHCFGRSQGRRAVLKARIVFAHGRDYSLNAAVLVATAKMIAAGGKFRPGLHYLFDAVAPFAFMTELAKAVVQIFESVEIGG